MYRPRGLRPCVASVPSTCPARLQLLPSVAKRVRDPSGVALEIQALEAAALAKVGAGTKVIVMDEKVGPGCRLRCGWARQRLMQSGRRLAATHVLSHATACVGRVRAARPSLTGQPAASASARPCCAAAAAAQPATRNLCMLCTLQGESAKALARALRAAGVRRPYILAGGFRGWAAAGLAVRKGASEYDASPLDALSDTAETGAQWDAPSAPCPARPPPSRCLVAELRRLEDLAAEERQHRCCAVWRAKWLLPVLCK